MKITSVAALLALPFLAQSAPTDGLKDLEPRIVAICRARINAPVWCQWTPHTGNDPRYKGLQQANYVDVIRYAQGENVRHNGVVDGYVPPL